MAGTINPAAPHHLPPFITAPGDTDVLFVVIVITLLVAILLIGNFYFKLHALPEHMAHRSQSTQFQVVGILALLALFTHNNLFWVAALLIAAFEVPDFTTPLNAISGAINDLSAKIERMGGRTEPAPAATATNEGEAPPAAPEPPGQPGHGE